MATIILLHKSDYEYGFEGVTFPVKVQAEPYRFEADPSMTLDNFMMVSNDELIRIGYTGPLLDGGLGFAAYNQSYRRPGPFDFWNALKQSRDTGALPALAL